MYNTNMTACQEAYDRRLPHDYNDIDPDLKMDILISNLDLTAITAEQSSFITAYAYMTDDGEALMSRILHAAITSPDFIAAHPGLAAGFAEFAIEAENEREVEL